MRCLCALTASAPPQLGGVTRVNEPLNLLLTAGAYRRQRGLEYGYGGNAFDFF
jgi:hypothetical protein